MRRLPIAASIGVPSKARFARITLLACLLAAAFLFASPSVSFAQTAGDSTQNFGLDSEFSQVAVQSDRDLKSVITTIVNIALGFLGTVAVIIIIYAGYLWMTASGNEEQITRAKSILRNAVIGLVIIMASWAIAAFVINRLGGAIGSGGDGPGDSGGGLPPGSGSSAAFVVSSVETSHIPPEGSPKERVTMCSSVQAQFNHYVGEDSFEDLKDGEELAVMYRAGEVVLKESSVRVARRNNVVSFKRENGDGSRADWQPQTTYDVRLAKELRDGRGLALANCADCDSEEEQFWRWTFATGQVSDRDVIAPRVGAVYPEDGATGVPRSAIFSVSFSEAVDAESLMAADGSLNAGNIILQRNDPQTGSFGAPFAGSMFDVTVRESGILFSVNASYTAIDGARGALEPYTEYRLIIQGIQDLCGNPLDLSGEDDTDADGIPDIDIVFETGADLPGVSFVRPSDGYAHSCPATPAFVQFRTSMYNIRTQSCVVDPNGLGGLVLGGSLNPAGVTLRSGPEDNFSGTGSPMDYCRQYAFNLNPNDAADDLIPGTEYTASIDFIKPGGDSANAENHAWSFTAAGASACAQEPYLNYVSGLGRNQGQWRQCLTASGAHFGDSKAASSRIATALSLDSPRNLPLLTQPITDAWTSHERIAVPDTNWSSESIAADFIGPPAEPIPSQPKVDFDIAVEVDHGAPIGVLTSNAVRFAVDTTQTFNGPCLYSISPTAGYWGDSVTLTGSRLGLAPAGQMTFYNQKTQAGSSAALWSNTRIQSRVPDLAQNNPADGEVFVTVGGVQSNKLEFNLRAGVGQSCALDASVCAPGLECSPESLTCQAPDTFRVTSVQPVAACTDSCASAVISFEASKPIKDVSGNRVQLKKCPTASRCSWNDPGASPVGVSVSRDGVQRAIITPQTAGNTLDLNAWYLVRVAGGPSGVVATDGKTIANLNADTDGTAREDAYVWSFKTGSSACTVNRIEMNQPDIGLFEGESADISIRSYGPSNSCAPRGQELVVPDNFTWRGCAYVDGDVSFECRASCSAPVLGGEAIITVASGSSSRSTVTGSAGSSDGSLRAFACAFYDEGGTHLKDGAIATVYAACTANADCTQGGACAGSVCLQDGANKGRCSPAITNFSPASGPAGTWVTINGCYFGNDRGDVFIGTDPSGQPSRAVAPNAAWCGATWGNEQIIAEVAPGAINPGPVRVTRPGFDPANFGSYNPDGASHPGICRLSPAQGRPNDVAAIRGQGFGAAPGSVVFTVGAVPRTTADVVAKAARLSCPIDGWENNDLCIRVATAPAGAGTVKVARSTSESNAVSFRVLGTVPPGSGNPDNLAVKSYAPGDGSFACLNMVPEVVLRGAITTESLGFTPGERLDGPGANFYVRRTDNNAVVSGIVDAVVRGSQTTLRLYPDSGQLAVRNGAPPLDYQIVLKGGVSGLRSTTGGIVATDAVCDVLISADLVDGVRPEDCAINFDTVNNAQDTQCRVTHFEIEPVAPIFTCARDNCEGDEDEQAGHQRIFEAFPINRAGQLTTTASALAWSSSDPAVLSGVPPARPDALRARQELFAIHPVDGSTDISVRANIAGANISGSTEARVFLCANPWPPDMARDGLPFSDKTGDDSFTQANVKTNFSTFYCRDRLPAGPANDLPEIPKRCFDPSAVDLNRESCTTDAQCQAGETCKYIEFGYNDPGRSNEELLAGEQLLKEIFLSTPELNSTIIIQSLTNLQNSSASEWYGRQSYRGDPKPLSPPLDGFDAIQDGSTIYVGALNDTRGDLPSIYNNIYRIVVSDQAPADLIEIFKQLVSNWRFLVNIEDDNQKEALRRDSQRIKDAHTLARLLDRTNPAPALASGSFASGLSLSPWPSWDAALASDFRTSLPHDPAERIQCDAAAGALDAESCKTESANPGYACNAGTNAYMYVYRNQGAGPSFSVNLEYAPPANWNWLTDAAWDKNPNEACMDKGLRYRKP